ncbi:MAG: hypothetical protein RIR51_1778 [Bacteroidota bacterium]
MIFKVLNGFAEMVKNFEILINYFKFLIKLLNQLKFMKSYQNRFYIAVFVVLTFNLFSQDSYIEKINGTDRGIAMVKIPSGKFIAEDGRQFSMPAFWMSKTEITYEQVQYYLNKRQETGDVVDGVSRPSPPYIDFSLGMGKLGGFPANSMKQYSAINYCKWLYEKTGIFYRLPTEAEWEYACLGGGKNPKVLKDFAWYDENSTNKYHSTGGKQANGYGLLDILGNVSEWVLDQYQSKPFVDGLPTKPVYIDEYGYSLVKGGNYRTSSKDLNCRFRMEDDPIWNERDPQIPKSKWWNADAPFVGFRLVKPIKQPSAEEIETFFKTYLNE